MPACCCRRRCCYNAPTNSPRFPRYLKLDFLHSPIVAHNTVRYDPTLTRADIFARFMASIRKAAGPDVFILGCGLPVGPGLGWVDAARVSADAGESWGPVLNDKWNIPGGYSSALRIHNIIPC